MFAHSIALAKHFSRAWERGLIGGKVPAGSAGLQPRVTLTQSAFCDRRSASPRADIIAQDSGLILQSDARLRVYCCLQHGVTRVVSSFRAAPASANY